MMFRTPVFNNFHALPNNNSLQLINTHQMSYIRIVKDLRHSILFILFMNNWEGFPYNILS